MKVPFFVDLFLYFCNVKQVNLRYDPNLSIEENAAKCGVTVHAIRKYIQTNGIDRRHDAKLSKFLAVQKAKTEKPNATVTEIAKELGFSENTVRKYLRTENEPAEIHTQKLSKFELTKASQIIKSISNSQDEILYNILRLYVHTNTFDCDLTASIGVFYRGIISKPQHLYDKYPQMENVKRLEESFGLPNECFHSIVLDLPFIVKDEVSTQTSMVSQRFTSFLTTQELYDTNDTMLNLAYRLLKKRGYLIMKTMDIKYSGKQYWIGNYVQNKAQEIGFRLEDMFILMSKTKVLSTGWHNQHSARKYHSYFFVFKK